MRIGGVYRHLAGGPAFVVLDIVEFGFFDERHPLAWVWFTVLRYDGSMLSFHRDTVDDFDEECTEVG